MLLAAASHEHLEGFLREHFHDPALRLPPLFFYNSRLLGWLVRAFHLGAITLGRRVFVLPGYVKRDAEGRLTIPGWLAAHEATHVLQYERAGLAGFLGLYLRGYWRALRAQKKWNAVAHQAAYLAIMEEREAYEAEKAYATWRVRPEAPVEESEE
jgi:hypothetical protein